MLRQILVSINFKILSVLIICCFGLFSNEADAQDIEIIYNADNYGEIYLSLGASHIPIPSAGSANWSTVKRAVINIPAGTDINQCKVTAIVRPGAISTGGAWNGLSAIFRGSQGVAYTGANNNIIMGAMSATPASNWNGSNVNALIGSGGVSPVMTLGSGSVTNGTSVSYNQAGITAMPFNSGTNNVTVWPAINGYTQADLNGVNTADFDWVWPQANTTQANWAVFQIPCDELTVSPPPLSQTPQGDHIQCFGGTVAGANNVTPVQLQDPLMTLNSQLGNPAMVCNTARAIYDGQNHVPSNQDTSWVCYDYQNTESHAPVNLNLQTGISPNGGHNVVMRFSNMACIPSKLHYPGSADGAVPPATPMAVPGGAQMCHPFDPQPTQKGIEVIDRLGNTGWQTENAHTTCFPGNVGAGAFNYGQTQSPINWSCYDSADPPRAPIANLTYSNAIEVRSITLDEGKLICTPSLVTQNGAQLISTGDSSRPLKDSASSVKIPSIKAPLKRPSVKKTSPTKILKQKPK